MVWGDRFAGSWLGADVVTQNRVVGLAVGQEGDAEIWAKGFQEDCEISGKNKLKKAEVEKSSKEVDKVLKTIEKKFSGEKVEEVVAGTEEEKVPQPKIKEMKEEDPSALDGIVVGFDGEKLVPVTQRGQKVTKGTLKEILLSTYQSQIPRCKKQTKARREKFIVYVNGILMTLRMYQDDIEDIADMTAGKVVGVYNATKGRVKDMWRSLQRKNVLMQASAGKNLKEYEGRNLASLRLAEIICECLKQEIAVEIGAIVKVEQLCLWLYSTPSVC